MAIAMRLAPLWLVPGWAALGWLAPAGLAPAGLAFMQPAIVRRSQVTGYWRQHGCHC